MAIYAILCACLIVRKNQNRNKLKFSSNNNLCHHFGLLNYSNSGKSAKNVHKGIQKILIEKKLRIMLKKRLKVDQILSIAHCPQLNFGQFSARNSFNIGK